MRIAATAVTTHSMPFGAISATREPFPTPPATSRAAIDRLSASRSAWVSERASVTMAALGPWCSALRRSSAATVVGSAVTVAPQTTPRARRPATRSAS